MYRSPSSSCYWYCICTLVMAIAVSCKASETEEPISFRRDVGPILLQHCVACHGAKKAEGGYRLDTFAEMVRPGDSGEELVHGGAGGQGELLRRLTTVDESERMPAESSPLSVKHLATITAWIAQGAKFDGEDATQHLAFVVPPPVYPDPPETYRATMPVTAVAITPDGNYVLAGGYHEILVWELATKQLARRIPNLGERIYAIAFYEDGVSLAVACGQPGNSGEVRLVDFQSGNVKGVIARSTDVALQLAFRPGTSELAIAAADNLVRICDVRTQEEIRTLASHADWVTAVAWSDDGTRLATASRDKSAKVFDGESGNLLTSYQGHGAAVRGVAILPGAAHAISVGSDKRLHRWELEGGKKIKQQDLGSEGYQVILGGGFAFIPCANHKLVRFDLVEDKIVQEFVGADDWLLSAAWHAPSLHLVGGSLAGELGIWNGSDGALLQRWLVKP